MTEEYKNVANPYAFNNNPLIQKLAKEPNWTISDVQKKPLDSRSYLTTGQFTLAKPTEDWRPTVTLDELNADPKLRNTNRTYHLDASNNHVICIDIENTISEDMKMKLLQLPFQYLEYSTHMGFHGLLYIDDKYLVPGTTSLFSRTGIKLPDRTWEVICNNHYCTFTQNVIEPVKQSPQRTDELMKDFIQYLLNIMIDEEYEKQQRVQAANLDGGFPKELLPVTKLFPEEDFEYIRKLSPDNFLDANGKPDESRFEYNVCVFIRKQLANRIIFGFDDPFWKMSMPNGKEELSTEDYVYLTAYFAKEILPHRDKHDTQRDGVPYLLYICTTLGKLNEANLKTIKKNAQYTPVFLNKRKYENYYQI